jgi:hypothetical protein
MRYNRNPVTYQTSKLHPFDLPENQLTLSLDHASFRGCISYPHMTTRRKISKTTGCLSKLTSQLNGSPRITESDILMNRIFSFSPVSPDTDTESEMRSYMCFAQKFGYSYLNRLPSHECRKSLKTYFLSPNKANTSKKAWLLRSPKISPTLLEHGAWYASSS